MSARNTLSNLDMTLFQLLLLCLPVGSTSFDSLRASEVARSEFAGVTASISVFSLVMNCMSMSRIWNSMSAGWSPTGTFVNPGRSTSVRFSTASVYVCIYCERIY